MTNLILYNENYFIGDVNGMEALVSLSQHDEPVIGDDKSDYLVETFIDEVIDYHTHLENELPTKYVVFYFYQTDNITVVQKTVDLLERKENEVNNSTSVRLFEMNRFKICKFAFLYQVNFPIWIRAAIDEGVIEKSKNSLIDHLYFVILTIWYISAYF